MVHSNKKEEGAEMAVKITSVGTNIPTKLVIIHSFRKGGEKGKKRFFFQLVFCCEVVICRQKAES